MCKTNPLKKQKSLCLSHIFLAIFKIDTLTLALNRKAIFLLFGLPDVQTSAVAIAPRKKLELAGRSTAELETTTSPLPVNNHPTSPCGRCCRAEVGRALVFFFWVSFWCHPTEAGLGEAQGVPFGQCPPLSPMAMEGTHQSRGTPPPQGSRG